MFEKLKNVDVLIIDWESIKNKILLIIAILFFAGFTIGFCVGCGVENSLQTKIATEKEFFSLKQVILWKI